MTGLTTAGGGGAGLTAAGGGGEHRPSIILFGGGQFCATTMSEAGAAKVVVAKNNRHGVKIPVSSAYLYFIMKFLFPAPFGCRANCPLIETVPSQSVGEKAKLRHCQQSVLH